MRKCLEMKVLHPRIDPMFIKMGEASPIIFGILQDNVGNREVYLLDGVINWDMFFIGWIMKGLQTL